MAGDKPQPELTEAEKAERAARLDRWRDELAETGFLGEGLLFDFTVELLGVSASGPH